MVEQLDAPATVTAQAFSVDSVLDRGRSETSRRMKDVAGRWGDATSRSLPAGSYVVPAAQPFGLLAFYLLEPESEDGLAQWSFFDDILAAHADFPIVRITAPAPLRAHAVHD
jgi:dipeptidyl-peptidase-4